MSDHPFRYTREEARNLAEYYLTEAVAFHEQSNVASPIPAMRAANAIALSRAFLELSKVKRPAEMTLAGI